MKDCPCCSGKKYEECCEVFHKGKLPDSALLLMRSRYSAYALNKPDYIIETTHPASPQYMEDKFSWRRGISRFSRDFSFYKLEILSAQERGNLATVTFTAHISQVTEDATYTEKSIFEKLQGRWFYRGGQLAQGHAPNLVTTGQFRVLPLAYYGDPVLRRKADLITEITTDTKVLIEEMIETMNASDGVGLAAPQVHHSVRIFVIRTPIETGGGQFDLGEVKVFINPTLSSPSEETWETQEGCLSIPALRDLVRRPKEITVRYTTLDNQIVEERVSGWQARVIMHEYDHIDGIFFIDRLDPEKQKKWQPFLQNLEKRIHDCRAL